MPEGYGRVASLGERTNGHASHSAAWLISARGQRLGLARFPWHRGETAPCRRREIIKESAVTEQVIFSACTSQKHTSREGDVSIRLLETRSVLRHRTMNQSHDELLFHLYIFIQYILILLNYRFSYNKCVHYYRIINTV